MANSAQRKGKGYEREMAKKLKRLSGDALEVYRVPCSGAIDGFKGDLRIIAKDPDWQPWAEIVPECKKQESLNIWKAMAQAEAAAGRHIPIVLFSRNFADDYCCIKTADLIGLYQSGLAEMELLVEKMKGEQK